MNQLWETVPEGKAGLALLHHLRTKMAVSLHITRVMLT